MAAQWPDQRGIGQASSLLPGSAGGNGGLFPDSSRPTCAFEQLVTARTRIGVEKEVKIVSKQEDKCFASIVRSPMFSFSRGVSETMKQRTLSEVACGISRISAEDAGAGQRPGARPGSCEPARAQNEESRSGD